MESDFIVVNSVLCVLADLLDISLCSDERFVDILWTLDRKECMETKPKAKKIDELDPLFVSVTTNKYFNFLKQFIVSRSDKN